MKSLAAGRLAKANETQVIEAVAHLARRFDNCRERQVRSRIEIEHKATWRLGSLRFAIPRMKFHGADLSYCS
jgi:hypothetical protein